MGKCYYLVWIKTWHILLFIYFESFSNSNIKNFTVKGDFYFLKIFTGKLEYSGVGGIPDVHIRLIVFNRNTLLQTKYKIGNESCKI